MDDKPKLLRAIAQAPIYQEAEHGPILEGAADEITSLRAALSEAIDLIEAAAPRASISSDWAVEAHSFLTSFKTEQ